LPWVANFPCDAKPETCAVERHSAVCVKLGEMQYHQAPGLHGQSRRFQTRQSSGYLSPAELAFDVGSL
jgi:hypothetical protein